jgi:hypothetical protein
MDDPERAWAYNDRIRELLQEERFDELMAELEHAHEIFQGEDLQKCLCDLFIDCLSIDDETLQVVKRILEICPEVAFYSLLK